MRPPPDPPIERLTLSGIAEGLLEQLHLDRGIGYTIKLLVVRPRRAIEEYLFEDRGRMIRPFTLLLLSVGIATFLSLEFVLQEGAVSEVQADLAGYPERLRRALVLLIGGIRNYFNLFYLSSLLPLTLASFLLFRSQKLNLAEHLVLNSYLFSIQTIMYIVAIPILVWRESRLTWTVVIPVVYTIWFYKDVFDLGWVEGGWKTVLVFVIGQALWLLLGGLAFGVFLLVGG